MRVALAQMDIVLGDIAKNYRAVLQFMQQAADAGARVLVLPELWSTGYVLEQANNLAAVPDAGYLKSLKEAAQALRLTVIGSVLTQTEAGAANTLHVFGSSDYLGAYSKMHLFPLMHEPDYLCAGSKPLLVETELGKTGCAICYDLRFPELFRWYAVHGAETLLITAEWPAERIEHWQLLLRARAIENQCYVVGCNRAGSDGRHVFGGHSAVISPYGEILAQADQREEFLICELDLGQVQKARSSMFVLKDCKMSIRLK